MDIMSLQEINREYASNWHKKKKHPKMASDIMFWLSVVLILVAILSFNYNSFFTRPMFGYSLYLTEEENLLLVKGADNIDPLLTAGLIYQSGQSLTSAGFCTNDHQTVEIGLVKATFPKLGRALSFLTHKIYIVVIAAMLWIGLTLFQKASITPARWGVRK